MYPFSMYEKDELVNHYSEILNLLRKSHWLARKKLCENHESDISVSMIND